MLVCKLKVFSIIALPSLLLACGGGDSGGGRSPSSSPSLPMQGSEGVTQTFAVIIKDNSDTRIIKRSVEIDIAKGALSQNDIDKLHIRIAHPKVTVLSRYLGVNQTLPQIALDILAAAKRMTRGLATDLIQLFEPSQEPISIRQTSGTPVGVSVRGQAPVNRYSEGDGSYVFGLVAETLEDRRPEDSFQIDVMSLAGTARQTEDYQPIKLGIVFNPGDFTSTGRGSYAATKRVIGRIYDDADYEEEKFFTIFFSKFPATGSEVMIDSQTTFNYVILDDDAVAIGDLSLAGGIEEGGVGNVILTWTEPKGVVPGITTYQYRHIIVGETESRWMDAHLSSSGESHLRAYSVRGVDFARQNYFWIRPVTEDLEGLPSNRVVTESLIDLVGSLDPPAEIVNENVGSIDYIVTMTAHRLPSYSHQVNVVAQPGEDDTAENEMDYVLQGSGTLRFDPIDFVAEDGSYVARKKVSIAIIDDSIQETDETFTIMLTGLSGVLRLDGAHINPTIRVIDDDPPIAITDLIGETLSDGTVRLSWTDRNIGFGYQYRQKREGAQSFGPWINIRPFPIENPPYKRYQIFSGLNHKYEYVFQVRAMDGDLVTAPSNNATNPVRIRVSHIQMNNEIAEAGGEIEHSIVAMIANNRTLTYPVTINLTIRECGQSCSAADSVNEKNDFEPVIKSIAPDTRSITFNPEDFTLIDNRRTLAKTISYKIIDDDIRENDEVFHIAMQRPPGLPLDVSLDPHPYPIIVRNDDEREVELKILNRGGCLETNCGDVSFKVLVRVFRNLQATEIFKANFTTIEREPSQAEAGVDFNSTSEVLVFNSAEFSFNRIYNSYQAERQVEVRVLRDDVDEDLEQLCVDLKPLAELSSSASIHFPSEPVCIGIYDEYPAPTGLSAKPQGYALEARDDLEGSGNGIIVAFDWDDYPIADIEGFNLRYTIFSNLDNGAQANSATHPYRRVIQAWWLGSRDFKFKVRAKITSGVYSPWSGVKRSISLPFHHPRNLTATADNRTVTLNWHHPSLTSRHATQEGASQSENYRYQYRQDDGDWTDISGHETTSHTIEGLEPATTYHFDLRGISKRGERVASEPVTVSITTDGGYASPARLYYIHEAHKGDSQERAVIFGWQYPAYNTSRFEIQWTIFDEGDDEEWQRSAFTTSNSSRALFGEWLGTDSLKARVRAVLPTGSRSKWSNVVGPISLPFNQPHNFVAIGGRERVALYWEHPQPDSINRDLRNGYKYQYKQDDGDWMDITGRATSHTVLGLDNATTYSFQLRATSNDQGVTSAPVYASVTTQSAADSQLRIPAAIYDLMGVIVADERVELTWTRPAGADDGSIYQYRRKLEGQEYGRWMNLVHSSAGRQVSAEVSGLDNTQTYYFNVRAKKGALVSPPSNEASNSIIRTEVRIDGVAANHIIEVKEGSSYNYVVTLSSPIRVEPENAYELRIRNGTDISEPFGSLENMAKASSDDWSLFSSEGMPDLIRFTADQFILVGESYVASRTLRLNIQDDYYDEENEYFYLSVESTAEAGGSPFILGFVIPDDDEKPTEFGYSFVGDNSGFSLSFDWTYPNEFSGFSFERVADKELFDATTIRKTVTTNSFTESYDSSMLGRLLKFRVRAELPDGSFSDYSDPITLVVPHKPVSLRAIGDKESITLIWKPPPHINRIAGYQYQQNKGNWLDLPISAMTGYKVEGLRRGTTHSFRLRAISISDIASQATYAVSTSTDPIELALLPKPGGINDLEATPIDDRRIRLSWTSPHRTDDSYSYSTGYEYRQSLNGTDYGEWMAITPQDCLVRGQEKDNCYDIRVEGSLAGAIYVFRVRAKNVDENGNMLLGDASNEASNSPQLRVATDIGPIVEVAENVGIYDYTINLYADSQPNGDYRLRIYTADNVNQLFGVNVSEADGADYVSYSRVHQIAAADFRRNRATGSYKATTSVSIEIASDRNQEAAEYFYMVIDGTSATSLAINDLPYIVRFKILDADAQPKNLTPIVGRYNELGELFISYSWDYSGDRLEDYSLEQVINDDFASIEEVILPINSYSKHYGAKYLGKRLMTRVKAQISPQEFSSYSNIVSLIVPLNQPSNLRAARVSDSLVRLSWTIPSNIAGITKYQYSQNGVWRDLPASSVTKLDSIIGGLDEHSTYTFQVRAANELAGAESAPTRLVVWQTGEEPALIKNAQLQPGTIRDLRSEISSDDVLSLIWTTPYSTSDGTTYQYRSRQAGEEYGRWMDLDPTAIDSDGFIRSYNISGLDNAVNYFFEVRAKNNHLVAEASNEVANPPAALEISFVPQPEELVELYEDYGDYYDAPERNIYNQHILFQTKHKRRPLRDYSVHLVTPLDDDYSEENNFTSANNGTNLDYETISRSILIEPNDFIKDEAGFYVAAKQVPVAIIDDDEEEGDEYFSLIITTLETITDDFVQDPIEAIINLKIVDNDKPPTLTGLRNINQTNDQTPYFFFHSSSAGKVSLGGDCRAEEILANQGFIVIPELRNVSDEPFAAGNYSCTLGVNITADTATVVPIEKFKIDPNLPDEGNEPHLPSDEIQFNLNDAALRSWIDITETNINSNEITITVQDLYTDKRVGGGIYGDIDLDDEPLVKGEDGKYSLNVVYRILGLETEE